MTAASGRPAPRHILPPAPPRPGRAGGLAVGVDVAASHDALVVRPRAPRDADAVRAALYARGAAPARGAGGYLLAPAHVGAVLDPAPGVDVRWGPGARRFAENRRRFGGDHEGRVARLRAVLGGGRGAAAAALGAAALGGTASDDLDLGGLDDHQVVNVAAMTMPDAPGLCVFDEQGTGKTVGVIYAYDVLAARNEADLAFVVAPKSMVPEWARDFGRFMGDRYRVGLMTGGRAEKRAALAAGHDVLVTNYETVVSMEGEIAAALRRYGGRAVLVADESFLAKNRDAARTRALRRLREECDRAYVLCGTPAPNAPHDVVEQFNLADLGAAFAGVDVPADRDAARPVVRRAMEERGLFVRHLKRDVLPALPARRFTRVSLPLEPVQRRAYAAALDGLIVDVGQVDERAFRERLPSFFARRSALLQICSTPGSVVPGYAEVPAKLKALDAVLADAVGRRGEKVVLWSFYTAAVDAAMARYARYAPVRYDGTVADVRERREAVRRFQEDNTTMLFVANPAAAGAGLTLHRARLAIYESLSTQAAHYLQSLDRIHRRGQARDVEYLFLICDGTIEAQEYGRLAAKEAAAQDLLGDAPHAPLTRDVFLADALELRRLLDDAPAGGAP